ncbi:SCO family protein [Sphingomonas sp. ASV193]|uniref:SCO family protein n=1 Tax=Sphingomonas sp. ASV193 TaxID=3144405 RepID=UPI0032E9293F
MREARIILWGLVAVALGVIGWLMLAPAARPPESAPGLAIAQVGGPFVLTGGDGKPFDSASALKGRPYALFFGFTHCPDVCPTTLARLVKLRKAIGPGDQPFAIVFVTVDPERDTPAAMARYAALFGTPVVALTGSAAEIARVEKQWGVYAAKVAQPSGGYTMDHTATVFLVGRDGKFRSTIDAQEPDDTALAKLRKLAN